GSLKAQNSLGICYENGNGVEKQLRKAFECYSKSGEVYFVCGQYNVGRLYDSGKGVDRDTKKAFEWFSKSAEMGYEYGYLELGERFYYGFGSKADTIKAIYWLERAKNEEITRNQAEFMLEKEFHRIVPSNHSKQLLSLYYESANENTDIRQKFREHNSSPVNMHTASNKILGIVFLGYLHLYGIGLVRDVDVPAPPTPTLKKLQFSSTILMHDTWTRDDYDRRGDHSTCNKLTPLLAQRIKQELNEYKMEEMEVHEDSKKNTHFFA
ncbi:11736_t:CDS:2, partial [Acaulospora morrowiae]